MDDENAREELYNRFKASLSQPVSDRFFDEDELVELYDYAGDKNDDYVQMEVLFCGARLYPESAALSDRRALLYLETTIDDSDLPTPAAAKFIADNPEHFSPIFDIARLMTNKPDDPVAALEFLLSQYNTFSDEEIIRFLELAFEINQYEWVVANLDLLRTKVEYPPVLLYELMRESESLYNDELVIKLAEELIEGEPFSVGYWVTLFKAQARAGKEDDAKSTFEYAKALSADNPDAILVLADAVYNFAPYLYDEAFEILEAVREENSDEFCYVDCQCALFVKAGAPNVAMELLKKFLAEHPGDKRAIRQLLLCNICDCDGYLERFYKHNDGNGFNDTEYEELVSELSMSGLHYSIDALLSASDNYNEIAPHVFCSWIESLFALHRYNKIVELVRQYNKTDLVLRIPLRGAAFVFAHLVSLMKLGQETEAFEFFEKSRPFFEAILEDSPMPIRMAVRNLFTLEDKMRRHPASDKLYWEYFDMLHFGKFH